VNNVKKKEQTNKISLKNTLTTYFKGVRLEWDKITWPERRQVFVETIIVIGVVIFFTATVYVIDIIFKGLFDIIS